MSKADFRYIDHVSDAIVEAYGHTLSEAFEQSAMALTNIMCDVSRVSPQTSINIRTSGFDQKSLLYNWLENVLLALLVDNLVLAEFNITIRKYKGEFRLNGICKGELFFRHKHGYKVEVKAITYHEMKILYRAGRWTVRFLADL